MKKIIIALVFLSSTNILSFAQNLPSYVPSNGLVAWWPFNGNANDASGNGNNGTVNGATPTTDRMGYSNAAYSFNGSNWIEMSNQFFPINIASGYTLSGWVLNPSTLSREIIFSYYDCSTFCRGIETSIHNDTLVTAIRKNNTTVISTKYRIPSTINWFFVTATFSNGQLKSYVNGVLVDSNINTEITNINLNTEKLNFGVLKSTYFNPPLLHLTGKMDDIGFWNRALTESEIKGLYNANLCFEKISVTDTLVINVNRTGYNPITFENTLKVYPNPTKDRITIDNGNLSRMNGYSVKIMNSLGQQVFQSNINQQQFIIDITTWGGNGIYFLQLLDASNNLIEIKKILLQ